MQPLTCELIQKQQINLWNIQKDNAHMPFYIHIHIHTLKYTNNKGQESKTYNLGE